MAVKKWEPTKELSIMDKLSNTRTVLRSMGDDDALLIVNLMRVHYANHHQDDENFWMLPVTLYCVLYGLIEIGQDEKQETIKDFYEYIIGAYERAKVHDKSLKMEDFTKIIDSVLTKQRKMLGKPLIEPDEGQKEIIGRLRIVTATIYMAVRKKDLGTAGSSWAHCKTKATYILTLFTEKASKMSLLRAAYNICKDLLRFIKDDKEFKVRDFVASYVVAVMVKLEVLPGYADKMLLNNKTKAGKSQQGAMDMISKNSDVFSIFNHIKQLTEVYCYSWKQYELFPKCSWRADNFKKLKNFLECCYDFGFPLDLVELLVKDDGFLNLEASQMRLYSQKMMKNIAYNKQYHHMLATMDDGPRNNITSLESKIKPWIEVIQSVHISSVENSLEKSLCIEVTRQIMGGDLRTIPASFKKSCMPFMREMDQLLDSNDLKKMQEEDLNERFQNALDTLPVGDLKLLLEGVLNNLVTFSANVKTILENIPSLRSEVIREIMGGDLSKIPASFLPLSLSQEMRQLLTCINLENMQEEELKEHFRNVISTSEVTTDLKLLLEGVLKNLVIFSANAKTTMELQVKCKLCLFFTRTQEILTDVQEGSEELMILFSFCLMEKTKEKRENESNRRSDYYLHYVTSDPDAIYKKYQSCIDELFKRSPPYCTLLSDPKHGGIMLKICRDKDYATKRRVDSNLHVLLLDTSFFDVRDLESCLWKKSRDHHCQNTDADILSHLEKELPCLYDRQVDPQKWIRDIVRPLYDSIARCGSEPISEVKKYIDKYSIKLGAASRFHDSAADFLSNPTTIENKMEYRAIFAQNDQEFKRLLEARIKKAEKGEKVAVIFPDKETCNENEKKHFEAIEESMQSERVTFYYGFSNPSTNLPSYCHVIQTYPLERATLRKSSLGSFNFLININRLENVVSKNCMTNFIGSSKCYAAEWNGTVLWKMQIDALLLLEFPQEQEITNNNALASNSVNAQVPTVDNGFILFYGFLTKSQFLKC